GTHEPYVDIEAIRVLAEGVRGFERLAGDAWSRYRLPLAATEVHLGCSREEQLRWLKEIWESAGRLRAAGVEMRAVTAWALLGLYDWNSLLTRRAGFYESGIFDLRGSRPRKTALARMVRGLAVDGAWDHPVLDAPGWWQRQDRFAYAPVRSCPFAIAAPGAGHRPERARPLLIAGGGGALAEAIARCCAMRGLPYRLAARAELDLAAPDAVAAALARHRPWAIVNAAGFARVDRAELDRDGCWRDNVGAADVLARLCAGQGLPLLSFSSHLVFDGAKAEPYLEADRPAPLSAYGATKAEAETAILAAFPEALIIRSGPFFGPWNPRDRLARMLHELARGAAVAAADDEIFSPTYLPDLAMAALDLLIDGESGLWHLANDGAISPWALVREAAARFGFDRARLRGTAGGALGRRALRPAYSVLGSSRARLMPPLESALDRYVEASRGDLLDATRGADDRHFALAVGWR
ncbi:MAG: sugar nucleotide-binding protein, partial [Alphaproteobacteria bacterium]|nr:sugar nucleotide-binding protein [Alphaproteobacteria bacterium]